MRFVKRISLCFAAGLTACGAAVPETSAAPAPEVVADAAAPAPKASTGKADIAGQSSNEKVWETFSIAPIVLLADTYMLENLSPRYAGLHMSCYGPPKISMSITDRTTPIQLDASGRVVVDVNETGEINNWSGRPFWQRYRVFFDETAMSFPPMFKTRRKQVEVEPGRFETRSERILLRTHNDIDDILLAKLKTAKVMRLANHQGVGPSFDLTKIKTEIETLEFECSQWDAK